METPPNIPLERVDSCVDPHRRALERSLVAHRLIATRLLEDPAVVERAKVRLERWIREGRLHPEWSSRWSALLERPRPEIAEILALRPGVAARFRGDRRLAQGAPDLADLVDGTIGELSPFHETFGYYFLETTDAVRDQAVAVARRATLQSP